MVMEEFDQSTEQIKGDEFYERIEAPKFVDFTVPDHYHPDDRFWFCMRVGCDRKHEEEMDSEEIYKKFVLRVMAARSPNIKIRKMLNRKPSSPLKCPLTAPAKPSKSRISRLAVSSSIARKLDVVKDKSKPPSKLTATPKPGSKKSISTAKALTTPRNRRRVPNPDKFRSVRNPKPARSIAVPKTRVVAKALAFHSPKKTVRMKTSHDSKTPVGKLCSAMSKLEIAKEKRKKQLPEVKTPVGKLCAAMSKLEIGCEDNKASPLEKTARKQFRGREVKSRVFDSLRSHIGKETKPLMKNTKRNERVEEDSNPAENIDLSDERLRNGSLEGSVLESSKNDQNSADIIGFEDKALSVKDKEKASCLDDEGEKVNSPRVVENDDKENALPSNDTENHSDDKENAAASDDNRREPNVHSQAKVLTNQHADKVDDITKKPLKKSTHAISGPLEAKYRKPKPTNPKPFRLRTDERGILKEATMEKKLVTPLKEIATSTKPSGSKSSKKNQNSSQKNENCEEQRENEYMVSREDMNQPRTTKTNGLKIKTMSTKKCPVSTKEHSRVEGTTSLNKNPQKTKTSQRIGSNRTIARIGVIKEVEIGASSSVPRSTSRGRRPTTVPKEPTFHTIHVPKSCTRKVVA